MAKPRYHKPIVSIAGKTDYHICRSCKRQLAFDQFRPLASLHSRTSRGDKQLLHPFCYKCRCLISGRWRDHPSYSVHADLFVSGLVSSSKSAAKNRGLAFLIDKDDVLGMLLEQDRKCALTGIEMLLEENKGVRNDVRASIDRINSNEGYVHGNVHLVCAIVNIMKNDLSHQRFLNLCEKVVRHQANKEDDLLEALG